MIIGKEVINPRVKPKLRGAPIPFELVVVVIGTTISYLIGMFRVLTIFSSSIIR
jgi:hypothetical protein